MSSLPQGFSGAHYIANKLNMTNQIFNSANPVMNAIISKCNKTLGTNDSTAMCFYGIFMAYMVEQGFGMNSTSPHWTLEFKDKVCNILYVDQGSVARSTRWTPSNLATHGTSQGGGLILEVNLH